MLVQVVVSGALIYLIAQDPAQFHEESYYPAYTLSHLSSHIGNMLLFDFELPLSAMVLLSVHTYFTKTLVVQVTNSPFITSSGTSTASSSGTTRTSWRCSP